MTQGSKLREWTTGAAIVFVTLAVCFVVLEVGFRFAEARATPEGELWATYDADLGYRLNPKYAGINEHGMHDHPVSQGADRRRMLILGDSVAYYGDGVDDTFVGYLQATLDADPKVAPTRVYNAGVKGYTNYQELLWLKKYGLSLDPDVVGVAFVLNDLHRFLHAFRIEDGKIVGQSYDFTSEAVGTVDSRLYQILRESRFLVWLRRRLGDALAQVESSTLAGEEGFVFDYRPDFNTAWRDDRWPAIEEQLLEMRTVGEREGFRLFVVAFPFAAQYRADYLARDASYVMKPQRKLAAIASKLGIDFLDLYPMLEPDSDMDPDQVHLSPAGRKKVGAIVGRFVVEHGLATSAD